MCVSKSSLGFSPPPLTLSSATDKFSNIQINTYKNPAHTVKQKKLFWSAPFHPHMLTYAHEQTGNVPSKLIAAIKNADKHGAELVVAAHTLLNGVPFHHCNCQWQSCTPLNYTWLIVEIWQGDSERQVTHFIKPVYIKSVSTLTCIYKQSCGISKKVYGIAVLH